MKLIAIGDLHGKDIWKKIVEKEHDADIIVFMGDYFDSFTIAFADQWDNFMSLINFKLDNPEKVIMLIGNHDYHYLPYVKEHYSGFQSDHESDIEAAMRGMIGDGHMQMAYLHDKYLFTHAGVTKTWYELECDSEVAVDFEINHTFRALPDRFKFTPSTPLDNTGDSITQSPIWVRPRALLSDMIEGYTQVVGHTHADNVTFHHGENDLIMIDTMDSSQEYLSIINGVLKIEKL